MNDRPGLRRREGRASLQIAVVFAVLAFGLLAAGGLQLRAFGASEQGIYRRRAVAIAGQQIAAARRLPAAELARGGEFRPAAWIEFPGRPAGELPVLVDPARRLQQVYRVSWRAAEERDAGLRLDVRVEWGEPAAPQVYTRSQLVAAAAGDRGAAGRSPQR